MAIAILLLASAIFTTVFGSPVTPGLEGILGDDRGVDFPQYTDVPDGAEFLAYRFGRFDPSSELHKPVTFEGVNHNKGHFDLETGYFKAPAQGLYVFNFTSYKEAGRKLRLMKNNYEVEVLSDDGKGKAKSGNGRNILLQLDQGDSIWLRLAHGKHLSAETELASALTTFTGMLLTTEINNDRHAADNGAHQRRHKRSSATAGQSETPLQRMIRQSPPVSLVEKQLDDSTVFEDIKPNGEVTIEDGQAKKKIAFSVTCTKSMIGGHMADTRASLNGAMNPELSPNGRLAFDKTLVNIGNGFDIEVGQFVAPTGGTYFFTFNVGKFPRKKLSVMLMKNVNEVQSIIYNDSKTKAREIQGQSLMLQLKKNDKVWLRSFNNEEFAVYSNLGNYITFSGYLVYTD